LGDYVPRLCGIATFTRDLSEAVSAVLPKADCYVGAVNDRDGGYDYPERVRFELMEKEVDSYRRAADFLNFNNADVLCVQHEFGIYGGPAGSHLLALLKELRMPVVTTLHTILSEPNAAQRKVMNEISRRSDRLIVMADKGASILREVYEVPAAKIAIIPHGIPDVPLTDSSLSKAQFGVEGRTVLLTFGLIGPGKGIEHVIEALPEIVKAHPEVVYLVLGATHPNLLAREGERYRLSLEWLAEERGVKEHVIFYNRFVTPADLREFVSATDVYLTPYLNEKPDHLWHVGAGVRRGQSRDLHALLARAGATGGGARSVGAVCRSGGHRDGCERFPGAARPDAADPAAGLAGGADDDLACGGGAVPGLLPAGLRGAQNAGARGFCGLDGSGTGL
jgi:glycosyltransferase involved in cell wall biosynthesis